MAWPGSLRLLPLFNIYITKLTRPLKMTQWVFPQSSARSSDCGYFFSLPDQLNAYPADKNVFAPLHKKRSHKKGFCQLSSQIAGQPFAFRLHISGYILCCKSSKGSQWQKFFNSVLPCRIPTGKIQPARNK